MSFEAQVTHGIMWKKIVEAVKELVQEANLQITPAGIGIQAMDSAHVALVSLTLRGGGFAVYECSRNQMLGINMTSLSKILKTTENSDTITLRHQDDNDSLTVLAAATDKSKNSEFQLKLMEIDAETMSIPDMEYETTVTLGTAEFTKICKDMSIFGETIMVSVERDGVKFSASSDFGDGFVFLRSGSSADATVKSEVKREVKTEAGVKKEPTAADDDAPLAGEKKKSEKVEAEPVKVEMSEPISLSFALRYFTIFSKAGVLSNRVVLKLAPDAPCQIHFEIEGLGHLRYYLAPKVEEE